ncbi:MAG: S1C family serine protease [Acidimicrobiales bacterium]
MTASLLSPGAHGHLATLAAAGNSHAGTANVSGTPVSPGINVAAIAKAVDPAVVDINTVIDPLEGGGKAAGTGMIVSPTGEIVTNNHVVQGADTVTVDIPGHGSHQAVVIGTDPTADVAVLDVVGLKGLPTIKWGDSAIVQVGTPVVAIGNALGLGGAPTVTEGIISAVGRTITAADETGSNEEVLHGLLQTDAPIAPGNSGGPLVSNSGQVIGMDTAAASAGNVGASLGFAIPSNTVRTIAGEITSHRNLPDIVYGRQAFLGVEIIDSSEVGGFGIGFSFGLGPIATTPNGTPGVVVAAVDPGSPAAKAGIQSGDVITAAGGKATPTTTALGAIIKTYKPGQVMKLTVSTQTGTETLSVRLGQAPID